MELVHTTYLLRRDVINIASYQNGHPQGFDYIIFSYNLRVAGVPQLIDNREIYGCITLAENGAASRRYMETLMQGSVE